MKTLHIVAVLGVIAVGSVFFVTGGVDTPAGNVESTENVAQVESTGTENVSTASEAKKAPVGAYTIVAEKSILNWSAKKPLIDGYINSGTIQITEGAVTATADGATGSFALDMNTLDVGLTAKKPGKEGALEGHLKGEKFFNVAAYPTASFTIKQVVPSATRDTDFTYTLTGDLTMKGQTHEVSFPAVIYETNNTLYAKATTEIDRTKWGITSGSKNFFVDLGDNMIDDMIGLSITLEATKN